MCFDPQNVTFFHLKLLLDNSASFISSRMMCQKWKVILIFEAPETVCRLDLTDPDPSIFYERSTRLQLHG